MASDAEVLVHIAAPSTSIDDSHYRTLAQAYIDFQPQKRTHLPSLLETGDAPYSCDALVSPQLSFNSVWEHIRSPALAKCKTPKAMQNISQDGALSQESWVAPPSEVADSMPDNDITLDGFNTPTRILNYFLQTTKPLSQSSPNTDEGIKDTTIYDGDGDFTSLFAQNTHLFKPNIAADLTEVSECQAVDDPTRPHSAFAKEPFKEITVIETSGNPPPPQNNPLEEAAGEATVAGTPVTPSPMRNHSTPAVRSSLHIRSRSERNSPLTPPSRRESCGRVIPSTQLPERADLEPPSSKRPRLDRPNPPIRRLSRSSSDLLPDGFHRPSQASVHTSQNDNDTADPLNIDWSADTQINSIEPMPSNHTLGPKPPAYLEWFVNSVGIASRYKPKFQAREIRPFERGYWLLSLGDWDHEAKVETWKFLGNFIHRDSRAGWGTRACRDEQWEWIRLYGWEHIAGELYILLYVATYRRAKYMELTWYDGAGKELIIVGARAEKPP